MDDLLKFALENGMLDLACVQEQANMIRREKTLEQHKYKIWQEKNGKWCTYLPDKEKGRVLKWRKYIRMRYNIEPHTSFDAMKETLIYGAELEGPYGIPVISPINLRVKETVDFTKSLSRNLKGHRDKNVNFYVDDCKFTAIWNSPDKYIEHLKCFQSVCMPDFSIALGNKGMPQALNIYNKYRNHALAYYWQQNGIKVIPSVSVGDKDSRSWLYDGYPTRSTIAVCTNGRVKAKASRLEFCEEMRYIIERIEPIRIILYGRMIDELDVQGIELINMPVRNMTIGQDCNGNID